jgi:hypothetical protein
VEDERVQRAHGTTYLLRSGELVQIVDFHSEEACLRIKPAPFVSTLLFSQQG